MPNGTVPLLIAIIVLVILSGFFSSTETAYSCVNRIKLRTLATSGNIRARKALIFAEEKYDSLISTILIGNNIVNLTVATLSTIFFAKILANAPVDAPLISTIVITVAVLIFGEITPKFIAKAVPEKFAMTFYPLILPFYYLLFPFNLLFMGWKFLLKKLFRFKTEDVITEDEIMTVIAEAEEDGTIKEEETNLIRSVIEFDDVEVGDILVPRVNIVAIEENSSMEEIYNIFKKEGYSRLPVYKESIDTIIGIIHEKDFYNIYLSGNKQIIDIMQNAFYTTEHAKISKLLKQFQKNKMHLAVVLDEYGGTLGIVTLEDILEELVGEIFDEHDEEINYYKMVAPNTYVVDANAPLDDALGFFNLEKDENIEANTLSGFIIETLGEIPPSGKTLTYKKLKIEILKSTVKRILQVKITVEKNCEE